MGGGAAGTNGGTTTGSNSFGFYATGGSNGAYQTASSIPVVPGQTYQFVVGYGGQSVPTSIVTSLQQGYLHAQIYRNGILYADSTQGYLQNYFSPDNLTGGSSYALGYTANGGTSGIQSFNGNVGPANFQYTGPIGTASNGPTSPVSGSYVTYGGTGGGQGYSGGTTGGGNGNGYPTSSSISTAASFYGSGGGAGDNANGVNDYGKNGANGVIILNYVVASVILPPVSAFTGSPLNGTIPLTVQFTDQSTNGPTSWNWNFGDGSANSTTQNPSHTYSVAGSYTVTLLTYNTNATSYGQTAKAGYVNAIAIPATPAPVNGTVTTWYTPKTVTLRMTDNFGNPLTGVTVNAAYNSTTLPSGLNDLLYNYGMNAVTANEALNGTLIMSGTTDSTGNVAFTMLSSIQYNVNATYDNGPINYYLIYPQDSAYQLKYNEAQGSVTDSIWNDLYANGNTNITSTVSPDQTNVTFTWSYQDMTSYTTMVNFFLNGINASGQQYVVYTVSQANPIAGGDYQLSYTVPNIRGAQYVANETYVRSV